MTDPGELSEKDLADYREAFKACDIDGDGRVTLDEMKTVFNTLGLDASGLAEAFQAADGDDDGHLNFAEFITCLPKKR